jgi:Txe/YoeB family toxin of Txe-Axe toxin-antitoxin module
MEQQLTNQELTLEQSKSRKLNEDDKFIYTLYKSSEEEIKDLEAILKGDSNLVLGFPKELIYLCGYKTEINDFDFKDCLPKPNLVKTFNTNTEKREDKEDFYCYAYPNRTDKHNIVMHNEACSSFQCALSTLNADWFYVVREDKNLIKLGEGILAQIEKGEYKETEKYEEIKETVKQMIDGQPILDTNRDTELYKESKTLGETES